MERFWIVEEILRSRWLEWKFSDGWNKDFYGWNETFQMADWEF